MKKARKKVFEIEPNIWLQRAIQAGKIIESSQIKYAIFGAGALAAHSIILRPTIDIDFVVDSYQTTVEIMNRQNDLDHSNLQKEKDKIQVADFYFNDGTSVQIWDNNLYSLEMNTESWSRVFSKNITGYGIIRSISIEDLIVSKIGRYIQQKDENEHQALKNVKDIISAIKSLKDPDYQYIVKRLREGARRETSSANSKIHSLDWYFIREFPIYINELDYFERDRNISRFLSNIILKSKSPAIEYYLLNELRKLKSISKFQTKFILDGKSFQILQKRWKNFLEVEDDKPILDSKKITTYIKSLGSNDLSDYAKKLGNI